MIIFLSEILSHLNASLFPLYPPNFPFWSSSFSLTSKFLLCFAGLSEIFSDNDLRFLGFFLENKFGPFVLKKWKAKNVYICVGSWWGIRNIRKIDFVRDIFGLLYKYLGFLSDVINIVKEKFPKSSGAWGSNLGEEKRLFYCPATRIKKLQENSWKCQPSFNLLVLKSSVFVIGENNT